MGKKIKEILLDGELAYIPLSKGLVAIIDARNADLVSGRNWHAKQAHHSDGSLRATYAKSSVRGGYVSLHRLIMGDPFGFDVDHIDGNGLDCRTSNLRVATKSQNSCNGRHRKSNTSGVKGVHWEKNAGKWRARIRYSGKYLCLGLFENIEDAANAYSVASKKYHKEFGRTE